MHEPYVFFPKRNTPRKQHDCARHLSQQTDAPFAGSYLAIQGISEDIIIVCK